MIAALFQKITTGIKNLAPYRFWHFAGEPEDVRQKVQASSQTRVRQESIVLRDYLNSLEPGTRRFALARMQDAEKNKEILHHVLAAKVGCARELLDSGMLVASAIIMKQVTGWYCETNRPMPKSIMEMALLTIQAQAQNAKI